MKIKALIFLFCLAIGTGANSYYQYFKTFEAPKIEQPEIIKLHTDERVERLLPVTCATDDIFINESPYSFWVCVKPNVWQHLPGNSFHEVLMRRP